MPEERVSRRRFLNYAITAVICGIVAGVGGYYEGLLNTPPTLVTTTVTAPPLTKTTTVTSPPTAFTTTQYVTVTTTPTPSYPLELDDVRDKSLKYLLDQKLIPVGTKFYDVGGGWAVIRETASGIVGSETFSFTTKEWAVRIQYPLVPEPTYTVEVIWKENWKWTGTVKGDDVGTLSIHYVICPVDSSPYVSTPIGSRSENFNWVCLQNGHTWVKTYSDEIYQKWRKAFLSPEYVRDYTILYLRVNGRALPDPLAAKWVGGRETLQGLVGSETYVYRAEGITVTIKYPVVLPENTVYRITVESQENIVWQGQLLQRQFTPSTTS